MTAVRRGFDRLYDFAENVEPAQHLNCADEAETEAYFLRKALKMEGLTRLNVWRGGFAHFAHRTVTAEAIKALAPALVESGEGTALHIEGQKHLHYALTRDLPHIE